MHMTIGISNKDSVKQITWTAPKDVSLAWWLRVYVIKGIYHSLVRGQKITPSTRYFRVVHTGKTIFLSSSGKKTLQELDIRDGDAIAI